MPEQIIGKIPVPNPNKTAQPSSGGWGKTIGGILGGTVGQIVGTPADIIAGPGGTMAGGAIGGGLGGGIGEGIDQLMAGKGFDLKKIAGAGAQEGVLGAIPVGEEMRAIPLLGKLATNMAGRQTVRGVTGAVGGGLAQMADNLGQGKPLVQDVLPAAGGAALGNMAVPGLQKIAGFAGDALKTPGKLLFENLPKSIQASMNLAKQKLTNLETRKMADMVGYENIAKAKEWGITPDMMPEDVVNTVAPHLKNLGEELNAHLSAKRVGASLQDVKDAFTKAQRQVVPGLKDVDLNQFQSRIDDFLRQNISEGLDHTPQLGGSGRSYGTGTGTAGDSTYRVVGGNGGTTTPDQIENTSLPLTIVNKIKTRLGERFGEDPLYKQAYHNLQDLIETKSGQKDIIKGINEEYNTLREIKNASEDQMKKGLSSTMLNYNTMKEEMGKRKLVDPTSATLASLGAASMAIPGVGHVGAALGGGYALYRILNNALHDPVAAAKIVKVLNKPGEFARTGLGQAIGKGSDLTGQAIQGAIRGAGVRIPLFNPTMNQQPQSGQ